MPATIIANRQQFGPTAYKITTAVSTTSTTRSDLTEWSFPVVSGKSYWIEIVAMHQGSTGFGGGSMGVRLINSATGTIQGSMSTAVERAIDETELKAPISQISSSNTQVDSFLTTTGVSPANTPHFWEARLNFTCTGSGDFQVTWGSRATNVATVLAAGSVMMVREY